MLPIAIYAMNMLRNMLEVKKAAVVLVSGKTAKALGSAERKQAPHASTRSLAAKRLKAIRQVELGIRLANLADELSDFAEFAQEGSDVLAQWIEHTGSYFPESKDQEEAMKSTRTALQIRGLRNARAIRSTLDAMCDDQPNSLFHIIEIRLLLMKTRKSECQPWEWAQVPLEPSQIFARALQEVEPDRIRRCPICKNFFYAKRQDQPACSRKCVQDVRGRRWYAKDRKRMARALELSHEGKDVIAIAKELGVARSKVRQYVETARREKKR
jgi:hypothetical protein